MRLDSFRLPRESRYKSSSRFEKAGAEKLLPNVSFEVSPKSSSFDHDEDIYFESSVSASDDPLCSNTPLPRASSPSSSITSSSSLQLTVPKCISPNSITLNGHRIGISFDNCFSRLGNHVDETPTTTSSSLEFSVAPLDNALPPLSTDHDSVVHIDEGDFSNSNFDITEMSCPSPAHSLSSSSVSSFHHLVSVGCEPLPCSGGRDLLPPNDVSVRNGSAHTQMVEHHPTMSQRNSYHISRRGRDRSRSSKYGKRSSFVRSPSNFRKKRCYDDFKNGINIFLIDIIFNFI